MENREAYRQHYVPRSYLKHFGFERKKNEYQIGVIDKELIQNAFLNNIKKVCAENDLYTLKGETEEQRQLIENFYGVSFDDSYNKVYSILTDSTIEKIGTEESKLIISTAITLLFRNPKFVNLHNDLLYESYKRAYQFTTKLNKDYFTYENIRINIKGKTLDEVYKDYISKTKESKTLLQVEFALKLIELRKNDGINIVRICEEDQSLITSDNPIVLYNQNGGIIAPFSIDNIIKLPIDNRHNLLIYPHDKYTHQYKIKRINHTRALSKREMITSNREQQRNAIRFLLGNKEDLELYKYFFNNQNKTFTEQEIAELNSIDTIMKGLMKKHFA
jgi:hypothetical protein